MPERCSWKGERARPGRCESRPRGLHQGVKLFKKKKKEKRKKKKRKKKKKSIRKVAKKRKNKREKGK